MPARERAGYRSEAAPLPGARRVLFQNATSAYLQASGSNCAPIFVVCGLTYLAALGLIHLLVPRLEPARLDVEA